MTQLNESMHSLVTPEFTGTHQEQVAAAGYWVSLISQVRNLFDAIPGFDNRAAIINQLEKDVAIMKAELDNLSATVTSNGGLPQMAQPAPVNAPALEIEPTAQPHEVNLAQEALIARLKANAGVPQDLIKVHPLSRLK